MYVLHLKEPKKMTFNYQIFENIFKIIDIKLTYTLQIKLENQQFPAKRYNFSDTHFGLFRCLALMGLSIPRPRLRN